MLRYTVFAVLLTIVAISVLAKGLYIVVAEHDYWEEVSSMKKIDSISVPPVRGNILSDNGQQLACNLPEYRMYMDLDRKSVV